MSSNRSFFMLHVMVILTLLSSVTHARTSTSLEQEISTGVSIFFPITMGFIEYGMGYFAVGGGGSYCYDAVKEQSFGYNFFIKTYMVPGYLYIKAGYGIAGLETGGRFGSLKRPLYGAEVLGGGRILVGEESPYFFLAVEAGAAVRTENVIQSEIISNPGRILPKIGVSVGMSFLRDYY